MLSINLPGKTGKPAQERNQKGWEHVTPTFGFVLQFVYISSNTTWHYRTYGYIFQQALPLTWTCGFVLWSKHCSEILGLSWKTKKPVPNDHQSSLLGCLQYRKASIEKNEIAYLENIIFSILSMYSFNSTDVQTTKYFRTGVNPKLVPVS